MLDYKHSHHSLCQMSMFLVRYKSSQVDIFDLQNDMLQLGLLFQKGGNLLRVKSSVSARQQVIKCG